MARLIRRTVFWLIFVGLLAAAYIVGRNYVRDHPQDVPWTPLALDDPIGAFTLRKLVGLSGDAAACRARRHQLRPIYLVLFLGTEAKAARMASDQ